MLIPFQTMPADNKGLDGSTYTRRREKPDNHNPNRHGKNQ